MEDNNIDIKKDDRKADQLLDRMNLCLLVLVVSDSNASLRSNRTMDYAITAVVDLTKQTYEGDIAISGNKLLIANLWRMILQHAMHLAQYVPSHLMRMNFWNKRNETL